MYSGVCSSTLDSAVPNSTIFQQRCNAQLRPSCRRELLLLNYVRPCYYCSDNGRARIVINPTGGHHGRRQDEAGAAGSRPH
jgi:hypothetical protein